MGTRRSQLFTCPALPTCGLALAEAERALPAILDELHVLLTDVGLGDLGLHMRMTGCPNGCARPYNPSRLRARGKNRYDVHLREEHVGVPALRAALGTEQ